MKRFLVAFFILLAWFCVGTWIYTCEIKGLCTENGRGKSVETGKTPLENAVQLNVKNTIVSDKPEQITAVVKDTTAAEKTRAFAQHKVLYFGFDSEKHKTDKALKDYISALKTYLNTYPDQKISITGHTDNVGETTDNEWIGMQRAKNAMKYLISQGIPETRIMLLSKGETEPIVPNTTKDGRRRNRRVEITINTN